MSRIGKKPVALGDGVSATIDGQTVSVKGPKGELRFVLNDLVSASLDNGEVLVRVREDDRRSRAIQGMSRTMIANLVTGVRSGFTRRLSIVGVGYRAQLQGRNLQLSLGFSHPVIYPLPEGIDAVCPRPTEIVISGIDKQRVGQVAAEIRSFRPPEPYKGKGVRYEDEYVVRKEGKKK